MKYIKNTTDFYIPEETAVSLGKFDGIHRGHKHLLEYLKEKKMQGQKSVIFTFDTPPAHKIAGSGQEKALTTNEEKIQIFDRHGIDYVLECPFTPEIRHMEPEAFVKMITGRLHIKSIVIGTDFRYGYERRGDYRLLQELSGRYGYEVEVVKKVRDDGRDISSTLVREAVASGRIEEANRLLGYRYFVQGVVAHGNEIGRQIGVPTANLIPAKEKLLPPFGVYVTKTTICDQPDKSYFGMTNVGKKPTIEGNSPVGVETHLFDFDGDLYGKTVKVEFYAMERPERKFSSLEELKWQLLQDIQYGIHYCHGFICDR